MIINPLFYWQSLYLFNFKNLTSSLTLYILPLIKIIIIYNSWYYQLQVCITYPEYICKKKNFILQINLFLLYQISVLINNDYVNANDDNFIIEILI